MTTKLSTIRKANDYRYAIEGGALVGDIMRDGDFWTVRLPGVIEYLDKSIDRCIGFVRGVEATRS